jgi:3-oxoacyl-[acyl-carrier protein] reductase
MSAISIKGKRVIVTGGSRGYGEGIVKALVAEGAKVASLARSVDLGQKVVDEANKKREGEAIYIRCDVGNRASVDSAFRTAVDFLEGLDALVNNAAVRGNVCPVEELTEADIDHIIGINAKGTIYTNQAAFPYLCENDGGSIVNFSSRAGVMGEPYGSHYSLTKAGILGWTRSVALEWGRRNIRVNSVCPYIDSPAVGETRVGYHELMQRRTLELPHGFIPLRDGSSGDAESDLGPVIAFLVSDASRFMTGQMFAVDGGQFFAR